MNRSSVICVAFVIISMLSFGCSSRSGNPVMPEDLTSQQAADLQDSQTHLWGLYDVFIDIPTQTATAKLTRSAMFTANVVNFVNGMATGLSFHINKTPAGGDYVDVDIDVSITHPFPGLTQYNGYDVRGVFMGDGSASMDYSSDLKRPVFGTDQFMLPDTIDGIGGPDGYTRWFNKHEFFQGAMPLFSYTQGKVATPGYSGTATLCPYKYFANDLSKGEDLWTWLIDPDSNNPTGVFTAGQANTRNYYLRFPNAKGVEFSYAILASWKGPDASDHPANAPEAMASYLDDNSTVYYVSPTENGGHIIFDVSLWDWDSTIDPSGEMKDYKIKVESTVLSSVYEASTSDMIPIDGGIHYSTYHIDIPADDVSDPDNNEYWVIAESTDEDYSNEFGEHNDAWNDSLAAFFRYDLVVAPQLLNTPPTITGITDDILPDGLNMTVYGSNTAVTYIAEYDDPDSGQTHTFKWYIEDSTATSPSNPPDSMPYNWGPKTPGDYKIWVKVSDGFQEVTSDPYAVTRSVGGWQWTQTWGSNSEGGWEQRAAYNVALDDSGNMFVAGAFYGTVDFNPGSGVDNHTSNGNLDCFLSKFDSSGNFLWAKTWGGNEGPGDARDNVEIVAVDGSGNAYVAGNFATTVDFNPGSGVDNHPSLGLNDAFLSKFDTDGNFVWARTWGGVSWDGGQGIAFDSSDNVYVSGTYEWTADFDPGTGVDQHTVVGWADAFLSKFDSSGNFIWAKTWGGSSWDMGYRVAVDGSGNAYVTGKFGQTVDFDPGSGTEFHTSNGSWDTYLSMFDSSGNFIWAETWGGSLEDWSASIAVEGSGNVYVTGKFQLTADFDPSNAGTDNHTSNGGYDVYLTKFDSTGLFKWAMTWGGSGDDRGIGVAVDGSGNACVTGGFEGTNVDFDPGSGTDFHTSNGSLDVYLSKFDSSGIFQSALTWGWSGFDHGGGTAVDASGSTYVSGQFQGTVDFDPGSGVDNHTAVGSIDFFLSRFAP